MKLVERHLITKSHPCWSEIDRYSFLSKNLFNFANYHYRQYFFQHRQKLNFNQLYHLVSKTTDYLALPTKVSKQIIRKLDSAWNSYLAALKEYKRSTVKIMRYSLLHRFQGGLIGSLLARKVAQKDGNINDYSNLVAKITENLINTDKIEAQDHSSPEPTLLPLLPHDLSSSEVSSYILPLLLFFHDNPQLLRQELEKSPQIWQDNQEVLETIWLWFLVISLALREKLEPQYFISQLLENQPKSSMSQQLELLQQLLTQHLGLEEIVHQLSQAGKPHQTPILLALSCFAGTPEDFQLSLSCALGTNHQCETTVALTGALAGIYNSYLGMPIAWRIAAQKDRIYREAYQQAERLFMVWCGMYKIGRNHLPPSTAIAAPNVIQVR